MRTVWTGLVAVLAAMLLAPCGAVESDRATRILERAAVHFSRHAFTYTVITTAQQTSRLGAEQNCRVAFTAHYDPAAVSETRIVATTAAYMSVSEPAEVDMKYSPGQAAPDRYLTVGTIKRAEVVTHPHAALPPLHLSRPDAPATPHVEADYSVRTDGTYGQLSDELDATLWNLRYRSRPTLAPEEIVLGHPCYVLRFRDGARLYICKETWCIHRLLQPDRSRAIAREWLLYDIR